MPRPPKIAPEKKIRIVLRARREVTIAEAARNEGVAEVSISKWRNEFLEAGQTCTDAGPDQAVTASRSLLEAGGIRPHPHPRLW